MDASPTATSRPWPTAPASASITSGSSGALECAPRTTSSFDRPGCARPVPWSVTTCATSRTAACPLAGSATASDGISAELLGGSGRKRHAPNAEAPEELVARSVVVHENEPPACTHEARELVDVESALGVHDEKRVFPLEARQRQRGGAGGRARRARSRRHEDDALRPDLALRDAYELAEPLPVLPTHLERRSHRPGPPADPENDAHERRGAPHAPQPPYAHKSTPPAPQGTRPSVHENMEATLTRTGSASRGRDGSRSRPRERRRLAGERERDLERETDPQRPWPAQRGAHVAETLTVALWLLLLAKTVLVPSTRLLLSSGRSPCCLHSSSSRSDDGKSRSVLVTSNRDWKSLPIGRRRVRRTHLRSRSVGSSSSICCEGAGDSEESLRGA